MYFSDGHICMRIVFAGVRVELAKRACLIVPYFKSERNSFSFSVWEMSAQKTLSRVSSEEDYYKTISQASELPQSTWNQVTYVKL